MKNLKFAVPLGGIIILLGAKASFAGDETQRSSTDAIPAPADHSVGQQSPASAAAAAKGNESPTYLRDVLPIFMGKCVRCHNTEATVMYNWLDYKTAFGDRWEIRKRVWDSWHGSYYKQPMPAGNSSEVQTMTEEERRTIKTWVETGAAYGVPAASTGFKSKTEKIEHGKQLFTTVCALCHQPTGQGIPNQFPPLAGSDFLNADKNRAIKVLLNGLQGEVVVNGKKFNNSMPSLPLGDEDIASALTFVYNSFGNSGKEVTPEEVKARRGEKMEQIATSQKKGSGAPSESSKWE